MDVEFHTPEAGQGDAGPLDFSQTNPRGVPERPDAASAAPDAGVTQGGDAGAGIHFVDAGPIDAGPSDAGPRDAGPVDAGPDADAGFPPEQDAGGVPCKSTLLPTEHQGVGEYLCSKNGRYRFGLNTNGTLALSTNGVAIWSAGTCCGVVLWMQRDGNLVASEVGGMPVFATNTAGRDGAFLSVEDDGRAVLWLDSKVIWSTETK